MGELGELCYSANGEEFYTDLETALDSAMEYVETLEEAKEQVIYIGEQVKPKINPHRILGYIYEDISEQLYDQCGEWSENFVVPNDKSKLLESFINEWLDNQNYGCFSINGSKERPITDYLTEDEIKEYLS